jgi:hypothetical protein
MSTEIKNLEEKEVKTDKPAPKPSAGKPEKEKPQKPRPKPDKPKPKLHKLTAYAGTVGEYGANADGIYERFVLTTADGAHTVKFPPHFGQALHEAVQPGTPVTVLGYLHTTLKGDEHLHLASLEAGGQLLRPLPGGPATEPQTLQGTVAELLRDPKGHPHALRLAGEASELRLPGHLGEQLADYLIIGAAVQASGTRRADRPGEVRAPGSTAPLQLELLTVGGESFLLR